MTEKDKVYLKNILDCIRLINDYTNGLTEEEFFSHSMVQDAVIRNFEIIGEAAKMVSESTRSEYNQIPWKQMAGMRDKLIHNYMGVDVGIIWKTINEILPSLEREIKVILTN